MKGASHRARVLAAVDRHLVRRCPPGFYPANELHKHVVMAGLEFACLACGAEAKTPMLPSQPGYNDAVEAWLSEHRRCA